MKKYSGIIKLVLLISVFIVAMFVFTGCATLDTSMNVDSGFKGTRVMDLVISDSDMQYYVEGGEEALDASLDKSIPADAVSYEKTHNAASSEYTYSFIISFTSLEEYTSKVSTLLNAQSGNTIVPEILFEETKTDFKEGLAFSENFNSSDLLAWFSEAVANDGVVTYTSPATEYDQYFIYNGEKIDFYSTYNDYIIVDDMTYNTFSSLETETKVNYDGSFKRTMTFTMDNETIDVLKKNKNLDVSGYFVALVSELNNETALFEETKGDGGKEYKVEFTAENVEKLIEYTNAILKNDKNTFDISIAVGAESKATVAVSETMDASHYLNYNMVRPSMALALYPGCRFADEKEENTVSTRALGNSVFYNLGVNDTLALNLDWDIMFAEAQLVITADSKLKGELVLSLPEKTNELFITEIDKFMDSIKLDYAKIKESKNDGNIIYTVDFGKGTDLEIQNKVNNFIVDYTGLLGNDLDDTTLNSLSLSYYKNSGGIELFSSEYSLWVHFSQQTFSDQSVMVTVKPGFGASFTGELKGEKEITYVDPSYVSVELGIKATSVFIIVGVILTIVLIPIAIFIVLFILRKKKRQMALPAAGAQYQGGEQSLYGQADPMGMQPQISQQAPVYGQQAPVYGQQAPMTDQQAPMTDQQAPMTDQQAPMTDQQAPMTDQQAPQTSTPVETQIFVVPDESNYEQLPGESTSPQLEDTTPPAAPQE